MFDELFVFFFFLTCCKTNATGFCAGYISQRWVMAMMGMTGVTMAYVMRACLSITLTQMVKPVIVESAAVTAVKHEYCPMPTTSSQQSHRSNRTTNVANTDDAADRFDWDEKTQGELLSAFYYGYIITHLPGGVLSQKFGGKHTMGFGILSTAIFTLMTPSVAYMGSTPLTILRFVEGLGEVSVTRFYGSAMVAIRHWSKFVFRKGGGAMGSRCASPRCS